MEAENPRLDTDSQAQILEEVLAVLNFERTPEMLALIERIKNIPYNPELAPEEDPAREAMMEFEDLCLKEADSTRHTTSKTGRKEEWLGYLISLMDMYRETGRAPLYKETVFDVCSYIFQLETPELKTLRNHLVADGFIDQAVLDEWLTSDY